MPATRPYDAVVFDLLTALLDSWTLWNRCAGSEKAGMRWRREYLSLTYAAGVYRPYEDIVRQAAARTEVPDTAADALFAAWPDLQPWPEAPSVLEALAGRVPLGVATNCSDSLARIAVRATGAAFAAVATAESAGAYKPRPEPYAQVLDRLGLPADRVLFVAGSAADVPGASGAGMTVYWHNRMALPPVGDAVPAYTEGTLAPLLDLV